MLSPEHKRRMAAFIVEVGLCSGGTACRGLGLARSTFQYRRRPPRRQRERDWCSGRHELSRKYPRYGFRRIAAKLRGEGYKVGRKQVQKLRRAEGLGVPPPGRCIPRRGKSIGLPTQATHRGQVWTWDFIADATVHGGALRMLTVLDVHRKCMCCGRNVRSVRPT